MDSLSINSFDAFKFYLQNLDILKREAEGREWQRNLKPT